MMSFFCLIELTYQMKGAIKIHFGRFTAVIHNFLPTLSSQLTELSFRTKQKITLRENSFLENVYYFSQNLSSGSKVLNALQAQMKVHYAKHDESKRIV